MQWIKSIDELVTLRSIVERADFSDYDTDDAMIASALRKLFRQACTFPTKSVEEECAQKYDRFLPGR